VLAKYGYEDECKGYLAIHKSLFFKGELPKDFLYQFSDRKFKIHGGSGTAKLFHAFPLFYFWYHPQLTDDVLKAGFKRFTEDPFGYYATGRKGKKNYHSPIVNSRKLLSERQDAKRFFDSYGFMGGKEALIGPYFLFGSKSGLETESYRRGWFDDFSEKDILGAMNFGMSVLRGRKEHPKLGMVYKNNPRGFGQYIWPQISHYVQRNTIEFITHPDDDVTKMILDSIRFNIRAVLYFNEHPNTDKKDPLAIECQQRIMTQYHNGEFADWLNEMFREQEELGFQGK
jgi:hypothetical protein